MTFQEAGLNLSENEYREYPGLSYSVLQRYDREGYECLDSLFEPQSTPSLSFGSVVDCLMTQGEEAFHQQYRIMDMSLPSDTIANIIMYLHEGHVEKLLPLVIDEDILLAADAYEYQKNWKDTTRITKVRELGTEYYNFLKSCAGKTVVSQKDFDDAVHCVDMLKTDSTTSAYFSKDPFSNIEKVFQWQYATKDEVTGIDYKGMLDLVLIDHDNRRIIPCDLKTTKSIYTFESSFYKYRYYLQAAMYTELVKTAIKDKCPGLAQYTIEPYRFIAVSRFVDKPVVFEWDPTVYLPECEDPYGNTLTDWRDLLEQLTWAIKNRHYLLPKKWYDSMQKDGVIYIQRYQKK